MSAVATFLDRSVRPPAARKRPNPAHIPIALLGCGTVGSCVARHLIERRDEIRAAHGIDLDLRTVLVRNPAKNRGVDFARFTDSIDDVLESRPRVVIELLGGPPDSPAAEYVRRCLDASVHVVTANKTLIAHHGAELRALAVRRGVHLAYEASVAAGVPILNSLRQLEGDRVYSVEGILNGSTNFILSRLYDNGLSMTEALAEARKRGLVEPDPSADLSGRDAAEKLAVIAAHIGLGDIRIDDITVRGIESIRNDDVLAARRLGYVIRLVAEITRGRVEATGHQHADTPARRHPHTPTLSVGPALLPRNHRLASVEGADNGIIVQAHFAGELFFLGRGAGPEPTTSAILGDLLRIARDPDRSATIPRHPHAPAPLRPCLSSPPRPHFLRIDLCERRGPSAVFEALRRHGVSVKEIDLRADAVRALTHPVTTAQIQLAVDELTAGAEKSEVAKRSFIAPVLATTCERSRTSVNGNASDAVIANHALAQSDEGIERRRIA